MNTSADAALDPPRRYYAPLALLVALIAFVGFWSTYFGQLLTGATTAPLIIHIHAAVFVLWLALFIAQAVFAATGRLALHIRLGSWIMAYGVFLIAIALITAYVVFQQRVAAGNFPEASRRLVAPVRDMICFAPFLAAGWIYRRKPEVHKRIMLTATTILLIAAVSRMTFLGKQPVPLPQLLLVWLAPVYGAMAWDWLAKRVVHPVYLIGIAVMVSMRLVAQPLQGSAAWLSFTRWLAGT